MHDPSIKIMKIMKYYNYAMPYQATKKKQHPNQNAVLINISTCINKTCIVIQICFVKLDLKLAPLEHRWIFLGTSCQIDKRQWFEKALTYSWWLFFTCATKLSLFFSSFTSAVCKYEPVLSLVPGLKSSYRYWNGG